MAKRSERAPRSAAKTQVTSEAATETKQSGATLGFEGKLWLTADKSRSNMDAAEYTHVVFGLSQARCGQGDCPGATPKFRTRHDQTTNAS
jgi:hypothetical protein